MPRLSTILQAILLVVTIYLWVVQLHLVMAPMLREGAHVLWERSDFGHYFLSAHRVLGSDISIYIPPFSSEEQLFHSVSAGGIERPTDSPLLAGILAPIALLPFFPAWVLFQCLSLAVCIVAFDALIRQTNPGCSARERVRLLLVISMSNSMLSLICFSQVQGFIGAALIVVALLGEKKPRVAGALLGATVPLKIYTAPLLAFLLAARYYRILVAAVLSAVLVGLIPPMIDERLNYSEFVQYGLAEVSDWAKTSSFNQGVTSLSRSLLSVTLVRLQLVDLKTLENGIANASGVFWLLCVLGFGLLVKQRLVLRRSFLLALVVCVMCAPLAWPHYYILVWPYLIQVWDKMSRYTKLILWFSFPLAPYYVSAHSSLPSDAAVTGLGTSYLVWLPCLIFLMHLGGVVWRDLRDNLKSADCRR